MEVYQNLEDKNIMHICNICGKQTPTEKKLKQHQDAVHKSKELKCAECNHMLKLKNDLGQHIRAVYEGVKYPCRQCN